MWQIGRVVGSLERAVEQGAHLSRKRYVAIYIYHSDTSNICTYSIYIIRRRPAQEKRDNAEGLGLGLGLGLGSGLRLGLELGLGQESKREEGREWIRKRDEKSRDEGR
jgi:hypothetical protein